MHVYINVKNYLHVVNSVFAAALLAERPCELSTCRTKLGGFSCHTGFVCVDGRAGRKCIESLPALPFTTVDYNKRK